VPNDPYYKTKHWKDLVSQVWQRAKGYCEIEACNRLGKVCDHVIPRRRGGPDTLTNLRLLCRFHDNQLMQQSDGNRRNGGVPTVPGCFPDGSPRDPNHPWYAGGKAMNREGGSIIPAIGGRDRPGARARSKFSGQF
jgi:hypothetical protein